MSKILICTGIYPPAIGGPAQYAKEIENEFRRQGHMVSVLTYKLEHFLPPLVRHELFFWRTFFTILKMGMRGAQDSSKGIGVSQHTVAVSDKGDFIIALDTFSVGWPATVAAKILGKEILIRTGGDFLWESYVERTGDLVLFKDFYDTCCGKLTWREHFIFSATQWTLKNVSAVIFSTDWQRDIFTRAYALDLRKNFIVENFYGKKFSTQSTSIPVGQVKNRDSKKVFVAGTRQLKWKNLDRLKKAFEIARKSNTSVEVDLTNEPHGEFLDKIFSSYAVILVSLGDISPNMILDAIRCNKPFILTRENGLTERLKDVAILCDPENSQDIAEKILWLADKENYAEQQKKVANFNFIHSWREIATEIMQVAGQDTGRSVSKDFATKNI